MPVGTRSQSMNNPYNKDFFNEQQTRSKLAARQVVPLIVEWVKPTSVLDVGCGVGTWLSVFQEHGVPDILGIDGDYVDRSMLHIPQECFQSWDLCQPLKLNRRFDLAVSLEVAEHLPPAHADTIVTSLAQHAPIVMFSAAVPRQGGMNHLNEQWPDYWAQRFGQHGYVAVDAVRGRIWQNTNIAPYYRQNTLLYVQKELLKTDHALRGYYEATNPHQLSIVHPQFYLNRLDSKRITLRKWMGLFPDAVKRAVREGKL